MPRIAVPSVVAVYAILVALFFLLYTLVFAVTIGDGWVPSAVTAFANVVPLALIAAATYLLLKHWLLRLSVPGQTLGHALLAPSFALVWYALVLVCLMLAEGARTGSLRLGSFSGVALVWQMFQGVVIYALVAATTYALRGGREAAAVQFVHGDRLERYLTRTGDELVPVAVADIVTITGAQDYAQVTMADASRHLVRMSLGEFELRLGDARFVRVHRSTIVNIDRLGRAEPVGGGRMVLHMAGGQAVRVSRSGAQALRSLVI